ncbi:centriole, cilia and spindle-associated protein-like [Mytilus edulis]|uniref:centriole, cilia and spindle-associated protein-like n=1 Tax=Mytilus edulis TaxID=6550 RepID=UPI0039EEC118
MVFKRSEYGLQFKKSHLVRNIPEYYNNVEYRTHRRELEHAHTPLSWDFEQDSGDSKTTSEEEICDQLQQKLQVIEEKDDDKSEELIKQAKDKLAKYDSKDNQNTEDLKRDICKSTDDIRTKGDNKDVVVVQSKGDNDKPEKIVQIQTNNKAVVKSKGLKTYLCKKSDDLKLDLKSSEEKKKPKKLRPKSSPIYRPPFVAYGCGDKERETGVKKSFNVRASNDVYPAAMKALVDHHERQKKRETARKCLSARERKRKALVLEKAAKEVAGWQSEYRRMYPEYKAEEYARSVSNLQERPRCFRPYKF